MTLARPVSTSQQEIVMNGIVYIIGLVVVVVAVSSFFGIHFSHFGFH
jgi:hypothetical protein